MTRYLTTEQRRSALKLAYGDDREWIAKVEKMHDKQIYAVFNKLRMDGLINFDQHGNIYFRSREEVNELKKRREIIHSYHQITLDEWLKDNNRKEKKKNGKI